MTASVSKCAETFVRVTEPSSGRRNNDSCLGAKEDDAVTEPSNLNRVIVLTQTTIISGHVVVLPSQTFKIAALYQIFARTDFKITTPP